MEDQTISDELQHGEGYRLGHSGRKPIIFYDQKPVDIVCNSKEDHPDEIKDRHST
tara:strand:+ start:387 stop:551 length:165 start_codon:yes stop_codon:yes gene_type:complete